MNRHAWGAAAAGVVAGGLLGSLLLTSGPARRRKIAPKVLIISMFRDEADAWLKDRDYPKFEREMHVDGLSPLYPTVHCTADGSVCQLTTGESFSALTASTLFDLRKTYFLVAGISGINPKIGTLGDVTFAKFAVQVDLQYEFDAREIPEGWSTGYVPLGAASPEAYPDMIYGSEIFEVNEDLQQTALSFAREAELADSEAAAAYRAQYTHPDFHAATQKPRVSAQDNSSSNIFFHGHHLAEGFEKDFKLLSNGLGSYGTTAQEDTATLGVLLRAHMAGRVDFTRTIIMRTASNFDRPYARDAAPAIPLHVNHGGLEPSVENIYRAGVKVVEGILGQWDSKFERGVKPNNYCGDIFGSLGGDPPFGPGKRDLPQALKKGKTADPQEHRWYWPFGGAKLGQA